MMRGTLVILLLSWACSIIRGQLNSPKAPSAFERKEFIAPIQGVNMCTYKEVTESDGSQTLVWTCGLTVEDQKNTVKYDCCPGYKRSALVNNQCVEKEPTYMTIIETLHNQGRNRTAGDFLNVLPELGLIENERDFTVFVPNTDGDIQNPNSDKIMALTSVGRLYSDTLRDRLNIPTLNGQKLKYSTSPNGLIFLDCQPLVKPDLETANGLIQITAGPIQSTKNYPTVMSRLQADPNLSSFVADIPRDLRSALEASDSQQRFTVFAPDNQAWGAAKREVQGNQALGNLVRQHVMSGLTCGRSIDSTERTIGPTKANSYLKARQRRDGQRVVKDSCGNEIPIESMDIMAGNGVVHKIKGSLIGTQALDFANAIDCLAKDKGSGVSRAAQQLSQCSINVRDSDNIVVLLPTDTALNKPELSSMLRSDSCQVFAHGVLTPDKCKMKNEYGVGVAQECVFSTKYTAPNGDKPKITIQYIRKRDGSRIHFGKAATTGVNAIEFNGGVIYAVESMNKPPTKNMMSIIAEDPEMKTTYQKMQSSDFERILRTNSPNVVFLAPQNHGWITRKTENAYSTSSLRSLFQMQTIPHQLITGPNGNIDSETIQTVDSLSPTKLTIKRTLDGNTFVGHDKMDPAVWSLLVGEPRVATDGIVWPVDWPLICPTC